MRGLNQGARSLPRSGGTVLLRTCGVHFALKQVPKTSSCETDGRPARRPWCEALKDAPNSSSGHLPCALVSPSYLTKFV